MQRLVGNPKSVDDGVGGVSCGFELVLDTEDFADIDADARQDTYAICHAFLERGYIVDRVDAYYAWREFSTSHSASWLLVTRPAPVDDCKRFLVEDVTPTVLSGHDISVEGEQ